MKFTNRLNLPQPIYNAAVAQQKAYKDSHAERYDISVTELISPPQQAALKRLHSDRLEQDVADMAFAILGTAVHKILEDGADTGIVEQRYLRDMSGWTISGMVDYSDGHTIYDYKVMSVWEHMLGLSFEKVAQLNILRWLMESEENLAIVSIFRDWQKSKAEYDSNYPQAQIMVIPVPVWDEYETAEYITERVRLHSNARAGTIVECTEDDRWATQTKWAVMKGKNKRAVKLCDSQGQAFAIANGNKDLWVEKRPGTSKRCASYCPAGGDTGICQQWVRERAEK